MPRSPLDIWPEPFLRRESAFRLRMASLRQPSYMQLQLSSPRHPLNITIRNAWAGATPTIASSGGREQYHGALREPDDHADDSCRHFESVHRGDLPPIFMVQVTQPLPTQRQSVWRLSQEAKGIFASRRIAVPRRIQSIQRRILPNDNYGRCVHRGLGQTIWGDVDSE